MCYGLALEGISAAQVAALNAQTDPSSPDRKDPGNPLADYGLKTIDLGGRVSTRVVSEFVPGARVVKAFHHLPVNLLPEPSESGGKRVLF